MFLFCSPQISVTFTVTNMILAKMKKAGVNKSSSDYLLYDKHSKTSDGIEGRPNMMLTCKTSYFPVSSDTLKEARNARMAKVRKTGISTRA